MNSIDKVAFAFAMEMQQINALALNLVLVQCTQPCGSPSDAFSMRVLDLCNFTNKSKCALMNL